MLKANDRTDNLIAFMLALIVYIPATSIGNIIRLGVVVVAFVMKHMNEPPDASIARIALLMVLSPFVSSLFVVLLEGFNVVNWATITHEIQRMVFCALLLMTVVKMNINFRLIYVITIFVLLPNLIIQLLERARMETVFTFIRSNYQSGVTEEWTHLDLARVEGGGFRSGSIFINPNVYMAIPLMALVVFLHQDREKSSVWNYALIACAVYSCFLTGSRTGTVVMAIIMGWYVVKYAKAGSKIFLIVATMFVLYLYGTFVFSSRSAQIFDSGSLRVKIDSFAWYWQSTKGLFIYWVTGSIGSRSAVAIFDGEIGHLYGWYGFFGVYWYVQYYKLVFKNNRSLQFYTLPLTAVHIFVAITASVLLCMPIYPFAAILAFAKLRSVDLDDEVEGMFP